MSTGIPTFPNAQQAQIIRAHQRDIYHLSALRDQTETVLRSWLGTRWLTRRDKEIDLLVKCLYFGMTVGRGMQTLGEEYTNIWQYSGASGLPLSAGRGSLGTDLMSYPRISALLKRLPTMLGVLVEMNLALFYFSGTYYHLIKRFLGLSSIPENPNVRPPSYSLLGVLLAVRLGHRLVMFLRERYSREETSKGKGKEVATHAPSRETFLDNRPVTSLIGPLDEDDAAKPAEEDTGTALDVSSIPNALRAGRNCTLCLEERTDSCATECGHLFCWSCIVGWGREKAECPLCRQSLTLSHLLPIYNL
ncbi:hypothetical protein BDZ89DRAFT_1060491 [Hymenopellis radicata]|nr:hypothetical protein BDZ89DRAFT_1060491 [Hymenopellis radicata]